MALDDSSAGTEAWLTGPDQALRPGLRPVGRPAAKAGPLAADTPARAAVAGRVRLHDGPTWVIAAVVVAAYTVISVLRYARRVPTSWDLGIFTEYVRQYAALRAPVVDIKGGGFNLLGDHFHPIVALIAPLFRIFPSPVTLLVVQAVLAGLAVLPVSQLGRELLGPGAGRCIAAAFGLSWGLQQMADYDFHEIAFAVPLLAFCLSAMVRGRYRAAVAWALPLVFVKEDQGFTLVAIGLVLAFVYRKYWAGLLTGCWGLAWSLLAITVIIPHFNPQHTYPYWDEAGAFSPLSGHASAGALWSTLSDGASVKLPTLALILLPTAFIALRSPVVLAAVPSLAIRAIDTTPAYWSTDWHYNATVMPIVFIAAIDAMARIRARHPAAIERAEAAGEAPEPPGPGWAGRLAPARQALAVAASRYGVAAMVAIAAALAFQFPLSSLWQPASYATGPHVAAENQAMAKVPDGVSVSTDLDLLAPLAARTDTYWLGTSGSSPPTSYVVFDTQSTDCSAWESVCSAPTPAAVLHQVESIERGGRYRQVYAADGVFTFRRTSG